MRTRTPPVRLALVISALAANLVLALPALADRAAIRAALDQMEKAVLAADQQAYLTRIAQDDQIFATEQKNWAKDLALHVPAEFSMSIPDDEGDFTDTEAHVQLTIRWQMGADMGDNAPTGKRKATYPALFRKEGDAWLFRGEDWLILEAPGVDGSGGASVKYPKGFDAMAKGIVKILPGIRAHVDEGFGIKITRVQEVKIYRSMRHLQESIYLSYTDPLGGWNEPGESIKILAGAGEGDDLSTVLAHEYGHVCTFEFGPKTSGVPWWVLEGVAELSAEHYANSADSVDHLCRTWARSGSLAPWEDMADFRKTEKKWMTHVYKQGQHMLGYISEKWGRAGRNSWLRLMANGKTIDEATREVMGTPFADLDTRWRASLGNQPPADHPPDKSR